MFSLRQKREIADAVQSLLRATGHPELPPEGEEIQFALHVDGAESWSWAVIRNNGAVPTPGINPWNEKQDPASQVRGAPSGGYQPRSSGSGEPNSPPRFP